MALQEGIIRTCANVKSRKQIDIPCYAIASHGDFCSRHYKNPIRFNNIQNKYYINDVYSNEEDIACKKIQKVWRTWSGYAKYRRQGPSANLLSISQNSTEVYSLEPIKDIPSVFLFSFYDKNNNVWTFDIRSLVYLIKEHNNVQNPYTRELLSDTVLERIQKRIEWLRKRNYSTLYPLGGTLTKEQIWNQKCLDIFMKLESFGYKINIKWFDTMNIIQHEDFYKKLYTLWNTKLELSHFEKEKIVSGYNSPSSKLFKTIPEKLQGGSKDIHWWRKTNLSLISEFLSRASDKSNQSLGAVYILVTLGQVISEAAEVYPWILESL